MTHTGHVFVSHSSDNRELANELAAFLEGRGVRVWIAPRDVRPGMDYSEQLQLAIESAVAFVVLVTEMANKSPYVRAETEMAFSTNKPIFPVRISDIQPAAGLALFLKIRHWTDAYGNSRSANLDRLAHELQVLTGANVPAKAAAPAAPVPPPPSAAPAPAPAPSGSAAAAAAMPAAATVAARPALPSAPANAEEEERWRAAVGPNADHYLERWKKMAERSSSVSWNWAACFANLFWFAYRKMWLPMAAMGVIYLINVALANNQAAARAVAFLSLGATFVTGTFGTALYRQQTARLVGQTSGQDKAAAIETLRKRGGVSQPALWGSIGFVVVLVLLMGTMVARQQPRVTIEPVGPFNTVGPADPNVPPPNGGDKPVDPNAPPPEEYYPEGY